MGKNTCIAMVPCPGLTNFIPLVEFAKRLVQQHHELHVTFLIPTLGPPTSSMKDVLNALPQNIDYTILPQVSVDQNLYPASQMTLAVKYSYKFLQEALSSLRSSTRLVALVFDKFSSIVLDIAKEFNLLSYIFFASGAITLSLCLSVPELDESVTSKFQDLTETVNVPGCAVPLPVKDLPEPFLFGTSSEAYVKIVDMCRALSLVDGLIVNSFTDLEGDAIRALQEKEPNKNTPPVYAVGPIIQSKSSSQVNKSECITWLDKQPPNSVLYVSFGSGGTLSHDQLNELAFGLELSGHKFLWAVRAPNESAISAYLVGQKDDPLQYLPSGFLDRTKGQGLVVPLWAPQIEVLSHGSTGGFLTHCGWSSILESVVHSVPLIAWPLYAEQKMNAVTITDLLKLAVRPRADETGIIRREEIAKGIKRIMEGDESLEIRNRIKDLSTAAAVALSENGSSRNALSSVALKWKST